MTSPIVKFNCTYDNFSTINKLTWLVDNSFITNNIFFISSSCFYARSQFHPIKSRVSRLFIIFIWRITSCSLLKGILLINTWHCRIYWGRAATRPTHDVLSNMIHEKARSAENRIRAQYKRSYSPSTFAWRSHNEASIRQLGKIRIRSHGGTKTRRISLVSHANLNMTSLKHHSPFRWFFVSSKICLKSNLPISVPPCLRVSTSVSPCHRVR